MAFLFRARDGRRRTGRAARGNERLGLVVFAQEERGQRARRAGDEEHPPDLEQDVQDAPTGGQRGPQRRRDSEQLYRREVERVEDRRDFGAPSTSLQEVDRDRADERDQGGQSNEERETGDE